MLTFLLFHYMDLHLPSSFFFFFFNDTATTEIYTLSLHDALPISFCGLADCTMRGRTPSTLAGGGAICLGVREDRKSTRLNSSHDQISYAVFCLKKKKKNHSGRLYVLGDDNVVHWRASASRRHCGP